MIGRCGPSKLRIRCRRTMLLPLGPYYPHTLWNYMLIRQTTGALCAKHCPSRGRTGGPCSEFRERSGKQQCRYRPDVLCDRQSVLSISICPLGSRLCPPRSLLTCWLMRMMPMSFLEVKDSKVDSIVAVSVLLSTTRKFFSWSAPVLTCCALVSYLGPQSESSWSRKSAPQCQRGGGR